MAMFITRFKKCGKQNLIRKKVIKMLVHKAQKRVSQIIMKKMEEQGVRVNGMRELKNTGIISQRLLKEFLKDMVSIMRWKQTTASKF